MLLLLLGKYCRAAIAAAGVLAVGKGGVPSASTINGRLQLPRTCSQDCGAMAKDRAYM